MCDDPDCKYCNEVDTYEIQKELTEIYAYIEDNIEYEHIVELTIMLDRVFEKLEEV